MFNLSSVTTVHLACDTTDLRYYIWLYYFRLENNRLKLPMTKEESIKIDKNRKILGPSSEQVDSNQMSLFD